MIHRSLKLTILALTGVLLLSSCPSPVESLDDKNDITGFKAFYLSPDINGNLSDVVIGEIEEDSVLLMVPGYRDNSRFSPSFDTDAETVMVGNQQQWSGQSWLDFSEPVEYTLITKGGKETDVTVSVIFTGVWQDLGGSLGGYSPKVGNYNGVIPFMTCLNGGVLSGNYLNLGDYTWYTPLSYSSAYSNALAIVGNTVFVPSVGSATPSLINLTVYYNNIQYYESNTPTQYTVSYPASGNIESLAAYSRDIDQVYLSFINSTNNRYPEMIRYYYDSGSIAFVYESMGFIETRPASSLTAAVSYGGIYAAVTYQDDTNTISLYQHGGSWSLLDVLPVSNSIVKAMIFDDRNNRLVIVTANPNSDTSKADINVYSYDMNDGTLLTIINPLTLNVPVADLIDVAWGNESVLVATRQDCYETSEAGWIHLGGGPYYDSPAPYFSVSAEPEGSRRYLAYTDSSGTNTHLRYLER